MAHSIRIRTLLYGFSLVVVVAGVACGGDDDSPLPDLSQLAIDNGLSTLVEAVTTAGLAEDLTDSESSLTIFAPTNAAFAALGSRLPEDPDLLANVLLHHMVDEELDSAAVASDGPFTTRSKTSLIVNAGGAATTVGGATLSTTLDLMGSNGSIHVMDEVIVPPTIVETASATAELSTLFALANVLPAAALTLSMRLSDSGKFTVFAPTNAAFAASGIAPDDSGVRQGQLLYHVATGQLTSDRRWLQRRRRASGAT